MHVISDIPTELIASFSATLEDALQADLILHVRKVTRLTLHHTLVLLGNNDKTMKLAGGGGGRGAPSCKMGLGPDSSVSDPDSVWIRIQSGQWIRNPIPDPDPGVQKLSTKIEKS